MSTPGIPWQLRIAAKLVLSRVPLAYAAWRRLGVFRHGAMASPDYACRVTEAHLQRFVERRDRMPQGVLEIGPGDSLLSAVVCAAHGCGPVWLVDAGRYAQSDDDTWAGTARHLRDRGLPAPLPGEEAGGLLERCNARYLVEGIESLQSVPDGSVELVWSQAVLEHLPRAEFARYLEQMRRVLGPLGLASHRVDLRDHLGGALNNLRFSERVWESRFMSSSGFYTNRIRYEEMLEACRAAGFDVEVVGVERWESVPTPLQSMAAPFRDVDDADLRVSGFDVVLTPR